MTEPRALRRFLSPSLLLLLAPAVRAQGFVECTRVLHVLEGEAAGDQFGWVSSPVPDVDGDGVEELLVGAPFRAGGAGRVYLYDGRTGAERYHVDGAAGEQLGFAVRDAGDLDGDGVGDVIVGGTGSGAVPGVALVLSGFDGSELLALRLGAAGKSFGFSVSGTGDVDGDGVIDLAVGATLADANGADSGRVVVVSGADGATVLRSYAGGAAGAHLGSALGLLGDVTGDGRPELAAGAANEGAGARGRAHVFDLAADALLYTVAPDTSGREFGRFFVASAGEIDGDGWPDLYVSDWADGSSGRGRAYFFSGPSGARLRVLTGSAGDGFGIGRPLGDLDGDGRTEMLLGSFSDAAGAPGAGSAAVFDGATGSRLRTLTSTTAGEQLGFDAHGLSDADGDGEPELVLTAASFGGGRGRVYVVARAPLATFGAGLAGTGGFEPRLSLGGCPRPGEAVSLDVAEGRGGAFATLLLGASARELPYRGGTLYAGPPLLRFSLRLGGTSGAGGGGAASLAQTIPADPGLVGAVFTAQALVLDPVAPQGVALSSALRIELY